MVNTSESLARSLARLYPGTAAEWTRALAQMGVRGSVPESALRPGERQALHHFLASRSAAPAAASPTSTASPPSAPSPFQSESILLLRWARALIPEALSWWQPWRLAGSAAPSVIASHHRRARQGNWPAPNPVAPLPDAVWAQTCTALALFSGASAASHSPDTAPSTVQSHLRAPLALLVALQWDQALGSVVRTLDPHARGRGWPVRLIARLTGTPSDSVLPRLHARRERHHGVDFWSLKGARPWGLSTVQPPNATRDDEKASLVDDLRGILKPVPPRPSDGPPLLFTPETEEALNQASLRWTHREGVAALGVPDVSTRGLTVMLEGDDGQGKRAAAGRLVGGLGLALFAVQSGRLGSRWIGETESRISAIFKAIDPTHSALLIHGAADLVAERTDVQHASDRYSNRSVNHLLQTIEGWPGLCLLTGPSFNALDSAMQRRVDLIVRFPAPDADRQALICEGVARWLMPRVTEALRADPEALAAWMEGTARLSPGQVADLIVEVALEAETKGVAITEAFVRRRVFLALKRHGFAVLRW